MATLPSRVENYLKNHFIKYQVASHAREMSLEQVAYNLGIPLDQMARAVLLKDGRGPVMAVLPVSRLLHLTYLRERLDRHLEVISGVQADRYFPDCVPGSRPPLGLAYGIPTIVDKQLLGQPQIYFEPGNHCVLVSLKQEDFQILFNQCSKMDLSIPQSVANQQKLAKQQRHSGLLSEGGEKRCHELLQMPNFPQKSFVLDQLIQDFDENQIRPELLSEQFHWEEWLSIFEAAGLKDSQRLHLAYDILVQTLALLRIANDGPLGYTEMVRQSLSIALLCGLLAIAQPDADWDPATAFLAGGCLNIGILLLGNLFPPEFRLLNRLALAYPHASVASLEPRLLGMGRAHDVLALGHAQVGGWLLRHWKFPHEVVAAVIKQDHLNYQTKDYILIAQVANRALMHSSLLGTIRGTTDFDISDKLFVLAKELIVSHMHNPVIVSNVVSRIIDDHSSQHHLGSVDIPL